MGPPVNLRRVGYVSIDAPKGTLLTVIVLLQARYRGIESVSDSAIVRGITG